MPRLRKAFACAALGGLALAGPDRGAAPARGDAPERARAELVRARTEQALVRAESTAAMLREAAAVLARPRASGGPR